MSRIVSPEMPLIVATYPTDRLAIVVIGGEGDPISPLPSPPPQAGEGVHRGGVTAPLRPIAGEGWRGGRREGARGGGNRPSPACGGGDRVGAYYPSTSLLM